MALETLNTIATEDTPSIKFDAASGVLELGDRSLPEDATEFYQPVFEWLTTYFNNPASETVLEIKLEYYNTTSAKQIFKMLTMLEEKEPNHKVLVRWFFMVGDEDMRFAGERFARLVDIPFEIMEVVKF